MSTEIPTSCTAVARPGDTLIVGLSGDPSADQVKVVADGFRERLDPKGIGVIVVSGCASMVVIRPDEAADTASSAC